MTDVRVTDRADEQLNSLDSAARERLIGKIEEATEWTEHRLSPLTNSPYYSLRAGDYRAIVKWDRENDVLTVIAAGHRRNIYDRNL